MFLWKLPAMMVLSMVSADCCMRSFTTFATMPLSTTIPAAAWKWPLHRSPVKFCWACRILISVLLPNIRIRCLNAFTVWIRAISSSPEVPVLDCQSWSTLCSIITANSLWKVNWTKEPRFPFCSGQTDNKYFLQGAKNLDSITMRCYNPTII